MKLNLFFCVIFLSGCGDSKVEQVRNFSFENDQTYANYQIFDNRQVCKDFSWSALTDKKGREVVEYRCSLRGVEEFFNKKLSKKIKDSSHDYDVQVKVYDRNMNDADNGIRIARIRFVNSQNDLKDFAVTDAESLFELLHYNERHLKHGYRKLSLEIMRIEDRLSELSSFMDRYPGVDHEDQVKIRQEDLLELKKKNESLDYLKREIKSALGTYVSHNKEALDKVILEKENFVKNRNDSVAEFERERQEDIRNYKKYLVKSAVEVVQWSIRADGIPTMIYAGVKLLSSLKESELQHKRINHVLEVASDDEITNYKSYMLSYHVKTRGARDYYFNYLMQ